MKPFAVTRKFAQIPVTDIRPDPTQPRKDFDLAPLISSIREMGIRSPITVRLLRKNYIIIDGERRWHACKKLKLSTIPAVIDESDVDPAITQLVLNTHRKNLEALEEAELYKRVQQKHGFSNQQLARWAHKSKSHISGILKLADLPKADLDKVRRAELSLGAAIKVAQKTPEQRKEEFSRVLAPSKNTERRKSIGSMFAPSKKVEFETKPIEGLQKKLLAASVPKSFEEWQEAALKLRQQIQEIHALDKSLIDIYNQVLGKAFEERKKIPGKRNSWGGSLPSRLKTPPELVEK